MLHGDSSVFCTILKSSAWKRWSRSHVRTYSPQSLFGPQSYGRNNVVFDELFCLIQQWIDFISRKCKWNKIIIRNCRRNETFYQNSINFVRARHAQSRHTHTEIHTYDILNYIDTRAQICSYVRRWSSIEQQQRRIQFSMFPIQYTSNFEFATKWKNTAKSGHIQTCTHSHTTV